MMSKACGLMLAILLTGCGSLMPSNYIGQSSVQAPQKINGKWIKPRLIPVSPQMLMTPCGRKLLAPALKPGMVLVIDNASFHKSKKIVELVEAAGCRIIFLPPYSPDFNPIEHHWAAVKNAIRKAAENIKDFYEAAVQALSEKCAA